MRMAPFFESKRVAVVCDRRPERMIARDYRKFISEFVANPKAVGAVAPSSPSLAKHLVSAIDWENTAHWWSTERGRGR